MKYIIVQGMFGIEEPIIFSESISHCDVGKNFKVISAGMVKLFPPETGSYNLQQSVIMGSLTLDINRDGEREGKDFKLLSRFLKATY